MYRILLVEDDPALAAEMKKQLESYGHEITVTEDFRDVTGTFLACAPQLVLMDIMLPFRDGYYWTAEIRKLSNVPVVFVSSASDDMDIVMAINMGGDDFIAKPVESMVLNAKVRAVLRRTYELGEDGKGANIYPFADAVLNADDGTVTRGEQRAELTKNELRILKLLLDNRGRTVSRESIMLRLWSVDAFVEENTLTVNVNRLRKTLADIGLDGIILTRPGSGYMIR